MEFSFAYCRFGGALMLTHVLTQQVAGYGQDQRAQSCLMNEEETVAAAKKI
jgi:hypothetical protein